MNLAIDCINKFILCNVKVMKQWVTLYEDKREKWDNDMKAFKHFNCRSMPYLDHLKENMPNIYPNDWLVDHIMEKYARIDHYSLEKRMHSTWVSVAMLNL